MSSLTTQQKMYVAAGANVLFVVSLFVSWFGIGDIGISGFDAIPSGWLMLLFAAGAAGLLAAQAFDYDLPIRVPPLAAAAFLSSVPFLITLMMFLEGVVGDRKPGLFIGLIASGVATAFASILWREEG